MRHLLVLSGLTAVLAVAFPAHAALIVYDGFDYGNTEQSIVGLGGSELGFNSANTWTIATSGTVGTTAIATYVTTGLTFGGTSVLQTTGGAVALQSGNKAVAAARQMAGIAAQSGTVWGSYLFSSATVRPAYMNWDGVGQLKSSTEDANGSSDFDWIAGGYSDHDTTSTADDGVFPRVAAVNASVVTYAAPLPVDTTFLCLYEITNVGGTGTKTLTEWVLTAAQFDYWKANGLSGLTASTTIGTAANEVYVRAVATSTNAMAIDSNDILAARAWMQSVSDANTLTIDELRLGATADDVTPLTVPEPTTLALLAAGGLGMIGGALRRRRQG